VELFDSFKREEDVKEIDHVYDDEAEIQMVQELFDQNNELLTEHYIQEFLLPKLIQLEEARKVELSQKLKKDETRLYHNVYGEGIFVGLDPTNNYIQVRFDSAKKTCEFSFPDAIGEYLFM